MRFDHAHQQLLHTQGTGLNAAWARAAAEEARGRTEDPAAGAEPARHCRPISGKTMAMVLCVLLTTALTAAGAATRPMETAGVVVHGAPTAIRG